MNNCHYCALQDTSQRDSVPVRSQRDSVLVQSQDGEGSLTMGRVSGRFMRILVTLKAELCANKILYTSMHCSFARMIHWMWWWSCRVRYLFYAVSTFHLIAHGACFCSELVLMWWAYTDSGQEPDITGVQTQIYHWPIWLSLYAMDKCYACPHIILR